MRAMDRRFFGVRTVAAVATVAGVAVAGITTPVAFASAPHLNPASTIITGKSLKFTFAFTVDGFADEISCNNFSVSGRTPADGLSVTLSKPPTITGCTDTYGTETVKTAGTWKLVANSTGSKLTLDLPVKSATFTTNLISGCVITTTPARTGTIVGTYNNKNTLAVSKSAVAASGSGCTTSVTATITVTVKFSPSLSVVG